MLLHLLDWINACISFILLTVNVFRNRTLIMCEPSNGPFPQILGFVAET